MTPWFDVIVVATVLAATIAVGMASASLLTGTNVAAAKADRLPVIASLRGYVTMETRHDGVSVLQRVYAAEPVGTPAS